MPQASYSFSRIHGYSYSLIACQAAYLATYYPSICWSTAYLRAISGLDEDESSNYGKIAKGIGDIKSHGVKVSAIDINKSQYAFSPDISNNTILYGLKAVNGINGDTINQIINNRPYESFEDFIEKTNLNKTSILSLIKGGAFDSFGQRKTIMKKYITMVSEPKKKLTFANFAKLVEFDLIPKGMKSIKQIYVYNKALKKNCVCGDYFKLKEDKFYKFFNKHFDVDILKPCEDSVGISQKEWKKIYDKEMLAAKEYIKENQKELLEKYNKILFNEQWNKYAKGNYSSWEMESLGMYYHDHELKNINRQDYEIVPFNSLSETPVVEYSFNRGGRDIPIYKTFRIAGTVISKDDLHSSICVLTVDGEVVSVKMNRDYYAKYNQRLSEIMPDGTKKVRENSWFQRGTLVILNGFRRGRNFVLKKYKKTKYHQMYRITAINEDGIVEITSQRYNEGE